MKCAYEGCEREVIFRCVGQLPGKKHKGLPRDEWKDHDLCSLHAMLFETFYIDLIPLGPTPDCIFRVGAARRIQSIIEFVEASDIATEKQQLDAMLRSLSIYSMQMESDNGEEEGIEKGHQG